MATLPQADQQQGIGFAVPVPGGNRVEPAPHSTGSFGSVFIVLAVIVVVSAVACCLGRFCSKSKNQGSGKQKKDKKKNSSKNQKPQQSNSKVGQSDDDDIEFGFGKGGLARPMAAGMREGPNGPHHKMMGPPPPHGFFPPQQKPAHYQQHQKKGYNGNSHHSGRFKGGDGNYPAMEFHDGQPFRH
ncbi:hypothetical protein LINGRAHAP2_LOCUS17887 [Linum grandiflorum]